MGRRYANIQATIGRTPVVALPKIAPEGVNLFVKAFQIGNQRLAWSHVGARNHWAIQGRRHARRRTPNNWYLQRLIVPVLPVSVPQNAATADSLCRTSFKLKTLP
jgi:hypothetical protein